MGGMYSCKARTGSGERGRDTHKAQTGAGTPQIGTKTGTEIRAWAKKKQAKRASEHANCGAWRGMVPCL